MLDLISNRKWSDIALNGAPAVCAASTSELSGGAGHWALLNGAALIGSVGHFAPTTQAEDKEPSGNERNRFRLPDRRCSRLQDSGQASMLMSIVGLPPRARVSQSRGM